MTDGGRRSDRLIAVAHVDASGLHIAAAPWLIDRLAQWGWQLEDLEVEDLEADAVNS